MPIQKPPSGTVDNTDYWRRRFDKYHDEFSNELDARDRWLDGLKEWDKEHPGGDISKPRGRGNIKPFGIRPDDVPYVTPPQQEQEPKQEMLEGPSVPAQGLARGGTVKHGSDTVVSCKNKFS